MSGGEIEFEFGVDMGVIGGGGWFPPIEFFMRFDTIDMSDVEVLFAAFV